MASGDGKITGSDIFDVPSVKAAYDNYIKLNNQATVAIDNQEKALKRLAGARARVGSAKTGADKTKALQAEARAVTNLKKKSAELVSTNKKLAVSDAKLTVEIKKATSAQIALNAAQRKAKAAAGGLTKAIKGFMALKVVQYLYEFGKAVFDTGKKMEKINLTLKQITESTYEMAEAQEFLKKKSKQYGIDLLTLSKRYTTFTASAKQSNLTLNESNDIFDTFANAGANLGLAGDEMGSIFLALEQMLSKGRVSTEELRRQLGEKLPGAMGIMADALGVTIPKLDKMLKAGEVLSADALPKMAKQVALVYSLDNTKKIDTMAAAQERLNTAWQEFVEMITEDGTTLNKIWKITFGFLTERMEAVSEWFGDIDRLKKSDATSWEVWGALVKDVFGFDDGINAMIEDGRAKELVASNVEVYGELNRLMGIVHDLGLRKGEFDGGAMAGIYLDENGEPHEEAIGGMKEQIKLLREEIEAYKKSMKATDEDTGDGIFRTNQNKAISGRQSDSTDIVGIVPTAFTDEVANMQMALSKYHSSVLESDKKFWLERFKVYQEGVRKISPGFQPIVIPDQKKDSPTADIPNPDDPNATDYLKISGKLIDELGDLWAVFHERRMEQIQAEQDLVNQGFDDQMKLAQDDEDLQAKILIRQEEANEKFEKKKRKAEYEEAKRKKVQALIDAAIQGAIAIIAAAKSGPWMIALTSALTAASIATIAAQPLPKYAKGTKNHPGGMAIVGDGGKSEIAIEPDGSAYISGDKPEVINMQKGSQVIPSAHNFIRDEVMRSLFAIEDNRSKSDSEDVTKAVIKGFKMSKINNNINVNIGHQLWRESLLN